MFFFWGGVVKYPVVLSIFSFNYLVRSLFSLRPSSTNQLTYTSTFYTKITHNYHCYIWKILQHVRRVSTTSYPAFQSFPLYCMDSCAELSFQSHTFLQPCNNGQALTILPDSSSTLTKMTTEDPESPSPLPSFKSKGQSESLGCTSLLSISPTSLSGIKGLNSTPFILSRNCVDINRRSR